MAATPIVRRLKRHQIDTRRWDAAVDADTVPLLYGLHWWMDAATDHSWEGVVLDDYRVVLALPRLRRLRCVPVTARPPYTQQVGPFGSLQAGDVRAMFDVVPNLPLIALPLGAKLRLDEVPPRFTRHRRTNFVLDLSADFTQVRQQFSKSRKRYISKYSADQLEGADHQTVVDLYRDHLDGRGGVKKFHFDRLNQLIISCLEHDKGRLYQVREQGALLCAGFFPSYKNRVYNTAAASTPLGLKQRGMSRLLGQIMALEAGKPGAAFDFAGSELPGVREYFASFGGTDEGYHLVQHSWLDRI